MNLIKQTLESIEGVGIYSIIAFFIFFVVFILVMIHTFTLKKADIDEMKQIPLDDDNGNQ